MGRTGVQVLVRRLPAAAVGDLPPLAVYIFTASDKNGYRSSMTVGGDTGLAADAINGTSSAGPSRLGRSGEKAARTKRRRGERREQGRRERRRRPERQRQQRQRRQRRRRRWRAGSEEEQEAEEAGGSEGSGGVEEAGE